MKPNPRISAAVAAVLWAPGTAMVFAAPADTATATGSELEEVIVTAQHRSESIQDVPITIQAITGDQLGKLSVTTFDDVVKLLPNVTFSANGPGQGNIYMRGLSVGFAGSQSSASINPFPNVATYLDEQSLTFPGRNLDVYRSDVTSDAPPGGPFDLIHARLLTQHLAARRDLAEPDPRVAILPGADPFRALLRGSRQGAQAGEHRSAGDLLPVPCHGLPR